MDQQVIGDVPIDLCWECHPVNLCLPVSNDSVLGFLCVFVGSLSLSSFH